MQIDQRTKILIVSDSIEGAYGNRYAYDCVPTVIDRLAYPSAQLNLETATFETYKQTLANFQPDLIFGYIQKPYLIQRLADFLDEYHPVPVINWFLEDPNGVVNPKTGINILDATARYDYWFSQDANMMPFWRTRCAFIPPAFDDAIYRDHQLPRIYDVSYIGQIGPDYLTQMYWPYMKALAEQRKKAMLCIDRPMGIPLLPAPLEKFIRSRRRRRFLQAMPFWRCGWTNPVDEAGKCRIINQSKIHFGMVRLRGKWEEAFKQLLPTYPIGPHGLFYQMKGRLFQGVAGGAMALNEYCPELEEFFDIDKEIVTFEYGNVEEVRDKLKWYLAHDHERERIAQAGYERAHHDHTFTARVQKILSIIRTEL